MIIGVDASNLRGGGGTTHLVELLRACQPHEHGFDQPQTAETLRAWFDEAKLDQVEVFRSGILVGRCSKAVS